MSALGLPSISVLDTIFYDFDGVMTDNRVLVSDTGNEFVFCNRSDGLAVSGFRDLGIRQVIISTETSDVVSARGRKLKIPVIHKLDSGDVDKGTVLRRYAFENGIKLEDSIFIGNDINDLPAMSLVGYPCCPLDAEEEVRSISTWISSCKGGYGVIRDLYRQLINKS